MHAYHQEHANYGPLLFWNRKVGREYLQSFPFTALGHYRLMMFYTWKDQGKIKT